MIVLGIIGLAVLVLAVCAPRWSTRHARAALTPRKRRR